LIVTVGLTFVLLPIFGSAGENVAVPLAVLQVVAPAAPAGDEINPSGSAIAAAARNTPTLRVLIALPCR
jgi:hypothetical protein